MRESQIEKEVCLWAKAQGILPVKFTPMGETGWPDRIFFRHGRTMLIEFKAPGKPLRPLQKLRIDQLRQQGIHAEYHDNLEDAIQALQSALISGDRDPTRYQPSVCGIPTRPRAREDNHHVQRIHHSAEPEDGEEDAGDLPPEASVQRVAPTKRHMG